MTRTISLIEPLRACLDVRSADYGLDAAHLTIAPILNWGGFVNQCFRVSDGHTTVFVKLAPDAEAALGLERWSEFASVLQARYHAPRVIGWIDVGVEASGGLVFEWLNGETPTSLVDVPLTAVRGVVRDLHEDAALAESLAHAGDAVTSCARAYQRSYQRRFIDDLAFIETDPPPFVDDELLEWMRGEALDLEAHVLALSAFAEPADRAIHGDLWLNNLLVARRGDWYVLDWDLLALGDPAMDWAMLFGPTRARVTPVEQPAGAEASLGDGGRERLQMYARAALLDWVIDPLSDWVQAATEPFHGAEIRIHNERVHREALAAYRERYRDR